MQEKHPQQDTRNQVQAHPVDIQPVQHEQQGEYPSGRRQQAVIDPRRIENGDQHDRPQIVDDGQRRQEHFQRNGHAGTEQRQHAEREGDVRRRRHAPSRGIRPRRIDREVDQRGKDHTAQRSGQRKRGLPEARQTAGDHFPFDLQPDVKEENGHQPVVDPRLERLVEGETVETDPQTGFEQMVISGRGPRKIGQHERQHRKQDQHHASGPRAADKFPQPGKAIVEIALMPEIECSGHRSVYSVPRAARAGAQAFRHAKGVPQILLSYECRTPPNDPDLNAPRPADRTALP